MEKVVLGLSGGVDSAVAAARLQQQGFAVHGLFLELGLGGEENAARAAREIGIPLYIAHEGERFGREVLTAFAGEYRRCRTPNPCILCNPGVKFYALEQYAREIGAAYVATGHYARVGRDSAGRALLLRAQAEKDQSYMLYRLARETIARCLFPLGEEPDKNAVRQDAHGRGLSMAEAPDSMDICFIPDGDTQGWLEAHGVRLPEGNFVDEQGRVLGRHRGLHCYTVGQRRGLGVAAEGRLFVRELRPETNEVVLSLEDGCRSEIAVSSLHLIAPEYAQNGAFSCQVRVRYSKKSTQATVHPLANGARVCFDVPVRAPAPGQSAVFYDGDIVIGGGFIEREAADGAE